jgi:hypothetical protein
VATYYVSATAPGGGDGSIGSPWTLAEFFTGTVNNDYGICSGTFDLSSALTVTGSRQLIGTTGAKFRATANIANQMLILSTNSVIRGFEIDLNGTTSGAINAGANVQVAECAIYGATAFTAALIVGSGAFSRCRIYNCASSQAANGIMITCTSFFESSIYACTTVNAVVPLVCDYLMSSVVLNWTGFGMRAARAARNAIVCGVSTTRGALQTGTNQQVEVREAIFIGGAGSAVAASSGTEVFGDLFTDLTINSTFPDLVQTSITNPFTDYTANDLRLTANALASVNADILRSIMIHFVDVPGPTFDSLSALLGGSGGGGFPLSRVVN